MFSDDNNISSIEKLFLEIKKYISLQREYIKLDLAEKLSVLISLLVLVFVLMSVGVVTLFYLTTAFVHSINHLVGSVALSYLIAAGLNMLIMLIVYAFRKTLIYAPIIHFISKLFLEDKDNQEM